MLLACAAKKAKWEGAKGGNLLEGAQGAKGGTGAKGGAWGLNGT